MTGRMLNETLGKWHFWLLFIGFHTTFLVQHWLGVLGMPRRYADYSPDDGFTWMNQLSTVGSFILAASMIPFLWNVYTTWRNAPMVAVDDPWGYGASLEWATSCPPPRHNFTSLPRIRSERPAFDLHHPEVAAMDFVVPNAEGPLSWEADRRGETEAAVERVVEGESESAQSTTTIVEERPADRPTEGEENDR
jgi:cytochrome c oxidase subunit 1